MPANIYGAIQINVISANGVVEFGDSLIISPKVNILRLLLEPVGLTMVFLLQQLAVSAVRIISNPACD